MSEAGSALFARMDQHDECFMGELSERIYVQVPSYRDKELLPTIESLLRTAAEPARLRIAIAWQYDASELALEAELARWSQVELIKIPAEDSRGCNWARALLQRRWDGEPYTLLLDSHHRFVNGWDSLSIDLHRRCEERSAKPILTGYLPRYDPLRDPERRDRSPLGLQLLERHRGMAFRLIGHELPDWRGRVDPLPGHFVSLHFLFARGSFNHDVPCDPDIYFFADEIAMALRSYTHGYDLYHPHRVLGWHLYDRATRRTHWTDHPESRAQREISFARLRELFSGYLYGEHGLGRARRLPEYERWIGTKLLVDL